MTTIIPLCQVAIPQMRTSLRQPLPLKFNLTQDGWTSDGQTKIAKRLQ